MVVNLSAKSFRSERKVTQTLYVLSRHKKKLLLEAPLAEVLDMRFLASVKLGRSEASLRTARDAIALALSALNIETLAQLQLLSVEDLALLPGLGEKSLAVLLDLLRAFGIELASKRRYKKLAQADGTVLARKLGLIT